MLISILNPIESYANDRGIEGIGGTLKIIKGEHKYIQMVSEVIKMDIYDTYYDVNVDFVFKNQSKSSQMVKMGFPENGHGDISALERKNKTGFTKFVTSINGKKTTAKRVLVKGGVEEFYESYWVKDVFFKANEKLNIHVEYRAKMGSAVPVDNESISSIFVEYNFTGGNWKGKIDDSLLLANIHLSEKYKIATSDFTSTKGIKIEKNKLTYHVKNWEAQEHFAIWFKKLK